MKSSRSRRSRLVPRVVYQTAFVGVIPLCVACSSSSSTGSADAGQDSYYNGAVGCAAFSCSGVAYIGFDSGHDGASQEAGSEAGASQDDAGDAQSEGHTILTVAACGFCGDAGSTG